MAESSKKLTDPSDVVRASEEYFDSGLSSTKCDRCEQLIQFRKLSPTVWEHRYSCGKYNGTMRGL
jgi:hypothetical protein